MSSWLTQLWGGFKRSWRSGSAEFLSTARRDAGAVRRVGQPPQHRPGDVQRRQQELRRGPADAEVPRPERGRGVLSGRGPAGPHPVAAATSLPAGRRRH